ADGLADVHQLPGGQAAAVALRAGAHAGFAGEYRTHPDLLHAGCDEGVDEHIAHILAGASQDGAVLGGDLGGQAAAVDTGLHGVRPAGGPIGQLLHDRQLQAAVGTAVVLADDDVLGDVHQAPGDVRGVGGAQRGVGQPLTGNAGDDEVPLHG